MQSFRKNLAWGFSGQVIAKACIFAYHFTLPHLLGREGYGVFALQFALGVMLLQPLLELGFAQLVPKWVGRGHAEVFGMALRYQLLSGGAWILIFCGIGWLTEAPLLLSALLSVHFLANSMQQTGFGVLRGLEDLRLDSVLLPIQNLLALAWVLWALQQGWMEPWVGAAGLAGSRLLGLGFLLGRLRRLEPSAENSTPLSWNRLLREAVALGVVLLMIQLYFRIDTAMLGWLRGESEVALYSAAYTILEGTFFIPALVVASLIGSLSREEDFSRSFSKGFRVLSLSGVGIGLTVGALAPWAFREFYPDSFVESGALLRLLSPTIALVFWGYLTTQALVALDQQRAYLGITALAVILNVSLNLLWIPEHGSHGAAWSTILTELCIPVCCWVQIQRVRSQ